PSPGRQGSCAAHDPCRHGGRRCRMTRTFTRHYEHHEIVWNGVRIAISYEPRWLSLSDDYGLDTAHLEIEAIEPERAMLPITETGYRSHFTTAATVDGYGGPVA